MTTPVNDAGAPSAAEMRAELGIRRAAEGLGVDPRILLDSRLARTAVDAINAQEVQDYDAAVAEAIKPVIERDPQYYGITPRVPQPAQQAATGGLRQWTMDDVLASSPNETAAAMKAGLLSDLGMPPRRRRR